MTAVAKKKPATKKKAEKAVERVLILRTCDKNLKSYGGFQWPKSGMVSAPDWKPTKECGNGLHGFLRGRGDGSLASFDPDAVWIAAWVDADKFIDLDGKVKFTSADVAVAGTREEAVAYLAAHGCTDAVIRGTATAGDRGTATAGYRGTATAGVGGTATAGYRGTATAGVGGTATAGDRGTATAGDGGTATAGYRGTATAGVGGTATAGVGGILNIRWWDSKRDRYRIATFYVGEDSIEPGVAYRLDDKGKVVRA